MASKSFISKDLLSPKKQEHKVISPIEHVKLNPETYLGSIELLEEKVFVVDQLDPNDIFSIGIVEKKITHVHGLEHMLMELLTNAMDNVTRSKAEGIKCEKIIVTIDENTISVENDGKSIPITKYDASEEKDREIIEKVKDRYTIDIIFSEMFSSSNYIQNRTTAGKFGFGAKVVNILSDYFLVESSDGNCQYRHEWKNQLTDRGSDQITMVKSKPFTRITFRPHLEIFGISSITDEMISACEKLAVDTALCSGVKVVFNEREYVFPNIADYATFYYPMLETNNDKIIFQNDFLKFMLIPNSTTENNGFTQISFVNGFATTKGGKHVSHIMKKITTFLTDFVTNVVKKQTKDDVNVRLSEIQDCFTLFLICTVVDPKCGLDKSFLEGPEEPFRDLNLPNSFLEQCCRWKSVTDLIEKLINSGRSIKMKGKVVHKRLMNVKKLKDANRIGIESTLIVCEGDSARAFADTGASSCSIFGQVGGYDLFGTYPLKGKILNTLKAKKSDIEENAVITDLASALGIKGTDVDYRENSNYSKLRYGRLLVVADADDDGTHIKGLLLTLINTIAPTLIERGDFLWFMRTPIIGVKKKKTDELVRWFYNERTATTWWNENKQSNESRYDMKYYKGLGTYEKTEVMKICGRYIGRFIRDPIADNAMIKAFGTDSDVRKDWLTTFIPSDDTFFPNEMKDDLEEKYVEERPISAFIDGELRVFSVSSCRRSIPSLTDGMKEAQRKVIYYCLSEKLVEGSNKKPDKVFKLVGNITGKTNYKHGEQSLCDTVIGLAQSFVGSNNVPLLKGIGEFGTRTQNGNDAANPRYIFATASKTTTLIFRKEDELILTHREDEGEEIEWNFFLPIIPMLLVNGSVGIGTGYSCYVPKFNPLELIKIVRKWIATVHCKENLQEEKDSPPEVKISVKDCRLMMRNEPVSFTTDGSQLVSFLNYEMKPWYRGFKGNVEISENKAGIKCYKTDGILNRDNKNNSIYHVTELPITMSINNFEELLKKQQQDEKITDYDDHTHYDEKTGEHIIHFVIRSRAKVDETTLHLTRSQMVRDIVLFEPLFDQNGDLKDEKIRVYRHIDEVINEFCKVRLLFYQKRKNARMKQLQHELLISENKARFIKEVAFANKFNLPEFSIREKTKSELTTELTTRNYYNFDNFSYILNMNFTRLTSESLDNLLSDAEEKKQYLQIYKLKPIREIWLDELNDLEQILS